MDEENVVSQEWIDANQKVIASWSVFHLIWSINHDLSLSLVNLYEAARKQGISGTDQENILLELEAKNKSIRDAYEYLNEMYVKYHFARLSHEQAPEQGAAYTAALDGVNKVRECLLTNTAEIERMEKEFFQGKFGFANKDQRFSLEMAFKMNKKLITILSVIEIWASARNIP